MADDHDGGGTLSGDEHWSVLRRRIAEEVQQRTDEYIAEMLHEGLGPREEEPAQPSHYDVEPGYYEDPPRREDCD